MKIGLVQKLIRAHVHMLYFNCECMHWHHIRLVHGLIVPTSRVWSCSWTKLKAAWNHSMAVEMLCRCESLSIVTFESNFMAMTLFWNCASHLESQLAGNLFQACLQDVNFQMFWPCITFENSACWKHFDFCEMWTFVEWFVCFSPELTLAVP